MNFKPLHPVFLVFIILNACFLLMKSFLAGNGFNTGLLIGANLLFVVINIIVFFLQRNALKNPNPNAFVRSVMGGMMIKMFVTIAAVFIYIAVAKQNLDLKNLFAIMLLYFLYLGIEVAIISTMQKQKNG